MDNRQAGKLCPSTERSHTANSASCSPVLKIAHSEKDLQTDDNRERKHQTLRRSRNL